MNADIWEEIGERLNDLVDGDIACIDSEGTVKFSTFEISSQILEAALVTVRTGVRVSFMEGMRRALTIPMKFSNLKGTTVLVGYEFSEETFVAFIEKALKDVVSSSEIYESELVVPKEVIDGFRKVKSPILCAAKSESPSEGMKFRGIVAAKAGVLLKHLDTGEDLFIFDDRLPVLDIAAGTKMGISRDIRPEVAYYQSIAAVRYTVESSGTTEYSRLTSEILTRKAIDDSTLKMAILENLKPYPEVLQTLKAFFENGSSIVKTSRTLKVHRNTVLNRLNKVRDMTYLDPKTFKDGVILYLVLID